MPTTQSKALILHKGPQMVEATAIILMPARKILLVTVFFGHPVMRMNIRKRKILVDQTVK